MIGGPCRELSLFLRRTLFKGSRGLSLGCARFQSNFVAAAGFSPSTQATEYGAQKLFLLENGRSMSYHEVNQRSGQFATLLNQKYGVKSGDRLLCRVSKTTDTAALYLAVLRLGAVYIPLNPAYTQTETVHFVQDAGPKLFISSDLNSDKTFSDRTQVLDEAALGREADGASSSLDVENVDGRDVACILYTSGTTGKPKGAMISHGALQSNAEMLVDFWRFSPRDINLHSLPFYHIHGLLVSFHCTLFSKSQTIFHPKFALQSVLDDLPKCSLFMGVPTFYARLVESPQLTSALVKNVRLFISGSATLLPALFDDFLAKTGKRICERYGMTETLVSTSNPGWGENGRLAGSAGFAVPGVTIRISDKGVVEVKSPALFNGYLNLPEKTKQEFTADGFFITGDMGYIDEKEYLWIQGRQKDMIISGGLNVYPMEIERLLEEMEWVKESAIIGVPHPDFGEAVLALCVLNDPLQASDALAQTMSERLRSTLAGYKRPKKIFFVDAFPRNHLGKVQKNLLREKFASTFQTGATASKNH